jgi:hypothetical protein
MQQFSGAGSIAKNDATTLSQHRLQYHIIFKGYFLPGYCHLFLRQGLSPVSVHVIGQFEQYQVKVRRLERAGVLLYDSAQVVITVSH